MSRFILEDLDRLEVYVRERDLPDWLRDEYLEEIEKLRATVRFDRATAPVRAALAEERALLRAAAFFAETAPDDEADD